MPNRTSRSPDLVDPTALDGLQVALGSAVILPGDERYDDARRVWNGMIDRRPAAVVRCRGVADVLECVRVAREVPLPLAVRGGGHNVAGFGTCDVGLVIDLAEMHGIRLDPSNRTVRCGGGTRWGALDLETQAFGLAVPGGIVSTTGVAGLTLGGGQGWLRRTCGMTCDSLVSADVVTADGRILIASESENDDLFWGLRGGGGNFGIVTSFEFRAHPVGPTVAFAGPVYPVERANHVMAAFGEFVADAPDEVNASATLWTIPPVEAFPAELHGRAVVILGAVYAGPPDQGQQVLRPLQTLDEPLLDMSAELPYRAVQQLFDPFFPAGELLYYWKSLYLDRLDEEAVSELAARLASRPSSSSMIAVWALGGAMGRMAPDETATGARDARFVLEILASWENPEDTDRNIAWARETFTAMERFGKGKTNLNFPGLGEDEEFVRNAFGDNYERLSALKRKYDPTNLFRLNQNIAP